MAPSKTHKRPRRGCVQELARLLVDGKRTVIITGAGISVASGVRPFRGPNGIWNSSLSSRSTRAAFVKSPQEWYNNFWIPTFSSSLENIKPNAGHEAIHEIMRTCSNVSLVTQNIDGLHPTTCVANNRVMEAHGRLGWYKCVPFEDDDDVSEEENIDSDDEDEDRLVHLGHRRHSRALRRAYYESIKTEKEYNEIGESDDSSSTELSRSLSNTARIPCRYELVDAIPLNQVQPPSVRPALLGNGPLRSIPRCPSCHAPCAPLALLFDEAYHSHDAYQFERIENLLEHAQVLVFVGTSFQGGVRLTQVALDHARKSGLDVFNFNIYDRVQQSSEFRVQNVLGPAQETLVKLQQAVQELYAERQERKVLFGKEVVIYTNGNKRRRGKREKDPKRV